MFFMKRTE